MTPDVESFSGPDAAPPTPLPSFPVRLVQVVVSPARLFDALRERPVWFVALLVGSLMVVASVLLIPGEIWSEMARAQITATGQEVPADMSSMASVFKFGGAIGGMVFWFIGAFAFAAVYTGIFAFVLGDRVSYRQMLSAFSHVMLIPGLGVLLLTPLRIIQRDPQLTLSVGTFFPGLEGYAGAFLGSLDLFSLWAWVLLGLAVSRFDPRRSMRAATAVIVGAAVAVLAGVAIFTS